MGGHGRGELTTSKSKPDSDFWAAYRDPRWQRRRLEVMERAGFKCVECGTGEVTLNVHHRHYVRGRQPWEYSDDELQCLCEECHSRVSERIRQIKELMGKLSESSLAAVLGYVTGLHMQQLASPDCDPLCAPDGFEMACGLADAYRRGGVPSTDDIVGILLGDGGVTHSALNELAQGQQPK